STFLLDAGTNPGGVITWNNVVKDSSRYYPVLQTGTYFIKIANSCGTAYDTIHITMMNSPYVDLGKDTSICSGQSITLDAGSHPGCSFQWNNAVKDSTRYLTVNNGGNYFVKISNGCGAMTD